MEHGEWLRANLARIRAENSPYAELFAREVLPTVKDIDFARVRVEHEIGRRRADFVIDEGELVRIAIEIDSSFHDPNQFDDREKDMELRERGWEPLRFYTGRFGRTLAFNEPPVAVPDGVRVCARSIGLELEMRRLVQSRLSEIPELKRALRDRNDLLARANSEIDNLHAQLQAAKDEDERDREGDELAAVEVEPKPTPALVADAPTLEAVLHDREALAADREPLIQQIMVAVLTDDERRNYAEAEGRHSRELRAFAVSVAVQYHDIDGRLADLEQHRRERSRLMLFGVLAAAIFVVVAVVSVIFAMSRDGGSPGVRTLNLVSITSPIKAGSKASITLAAPVGEACGVTYLTPAGSQSKATGLDTKMPTSDGTVNWSWAIGSETKAGTGRVHVNCGPIRQDWPIEIIE